MRRNHVPRELSDEYDVWHSVHAADVGGDSPWHRLVMKHLDVNRDVSGRELLEIGCGRGGFAARLAGVTPSPRRVLGADFSPVAVEAAATSFKGDKLAWEVQDITALSYPAASFDTVISCETIEHLEHPVTALRELARVLRPGGRLFLTTPNYLGLIGLYRIYLRLRGRRYTEIGQPINQFTLIPRTIAWIRRVGLRLERWDSAGHYMPVPGRPPITLPLGSLFALRAFGLHSLFVAVKENDG
jgi:2-polyprenyl-3-methyl-5-hydroxy-6-metoxy-1,4-benzoquinol methylase